MHVQTCCHSARRLGRGGRTAVAGAGFTLVEILVVVVILGIASAIIIPQIGTRDDIRTAAAARNVVADLIYAQNLAITSGKPVYVRFDKATHQYSMLTSPDSTHPKFGTPVQHPMTQQDYVVAFGVGSWQGVTLDSTTIFNGVQLTFQDKYVVGFDEIGSPFVWSYETDQRDDLKDGKVVIRAGEFTATIEVAAATGEITVK